MTPATIDSNDTFRILVADDEEPILHIYEKILSRPLVRAGEPPPRPYPAYEVTLCHQGEEALAAVEEAMLQNRPYALIFIDIRMPPGEGGIWAAERIRSLDPQVNIVFVTGFSDLEPEEIALRIPPLDKFLYLQKPFHLAEIKQFAATLTAKWATERHLGKIRINLEELVLQRSRALIETNTQLKQEIIARHREQALVLESEARLKSIFNTVPTGLVIIDPESHAIVEANPAALQMAKKSAGEVLGKLCTEYFNAVGHSLCAPGVPVPGQDWIEDTITSLEQEVVKIIRKMTRIRINNKDHVLVSFIDITAQKKAEEDKIQLAMAVEQAAEIIVITDLLGTICYVNPAFELMTGYRREESLGRSLDMLNSAKHEKAFYRDMWLTIAQGDVWKGRAFNMRKDGSTYETEATISPVRDCDGRIINFVAVARDITKETKLEAQLRQAQKMEAIGELAAGIAHEINTPTQYIGDNIRFFQDSYASLSTLLASYDRLRRAATELPPLAPYLREIAAVTEEIDLDYLNAELPLAISQSLEGNQRVAEIVRAMKEFTHPGSKKKQPVDINQAIVNTIAVARNEWKYVAEVTTDLDPELPNVLCLPGELNQAILNIIVNAAHAVGEVVGDGGQTLGSIAVRTRRDEGWAEIQISDTGSGIPDHIHTRIFDPFFTTKDIGKGTGQGLAIVHSVIVDKHHGTIDFKTKVGQGSTFIIRLPIDGA